MIEEPFYPICFQRFVYNFKVRHIKSAVLNLTNHCGMFDFRRFVVPYEARKKLTHLND